MEVAVRDYIKNMFSVESKPEWSSFYEGIILFDKSNDVWICGDAFGWIELKDEA